MKIETPDSAFPWRVLSRLFGDRRGAVAIYAAILTPVLIGFSALAIDISRYMTLNTELQSAADAAALAGAAELDGRSDAIERAKLAVWGTSDAATAPTLDPLASNHQRLATDNPTNALDHGCLFGGSTAGAGTICVPMYDGTLGIRFLHSLPADTAAIDASYETTDPAEARFIEVKVETRQVQFLLAPALKALVPASAVDTGATTARAVAGYHQVICAIPPLAICEDVGGPNEIMTNPLAWKGRQLLVKASHQNAQWNPGFFALLDVPDCGQATSCIADLLASVAPNTQCISVDIDVKPGSVQATRTALNVRFGMYENPFFGGGGDSSNPNYRPARNVTKGMMRNPTQNCNQPNPWVKEGDADFPANAKAKKLPRDYTLSSGGTVPVDNNDRYGNGGWGPNGRADYWAANHPDVYNDATAMAALTAMNGLDSGNTGWSNWTRYDTYLWELANTVPEHAADSTDSAHTAYGHSVAGESGDARNNKTNATCYTGNASDITDDIDRRIIMLALIDCTGLTGNGTAPLLGVLKTFITEPVEGPNNDPDIWLEVIDAGVVGGTPTDDAVLHDIVQLYR